MSSSRRTERGQRTFDDLADAVEDAPEQRADIGDRDHGRGRDHAAAEMRARAGGRR